MRRPAANTTPTITPARRRAVMAVQRARLAGGALLGLAVLGFWLGRMWEIW